MSHIYMRNVQAAGYRLLGQISILENILEELKKTELEIKKMSFVDNTLFLLQKCQEEAEEEIIIFRKSVKCLKEAVKIYKATEEKIADVYNLERMIYPKTKFGVNEIQGFGAYENLISFRTG